MTFPEKALNAWTLGNYEYLIHGEFGVTDKASNTGNKKYTCRIMYKNSDDQEGILDFANWSIVGVSGVEK